MNNKQGTCKGSKLLQFTICGVRGSPIELGRRLMKDGDDQFESGWGVNGVIPDSTLFANGEPGATMLQVSLDDEIVFERLLDFSKPEGLVFEDCGPLYDENEDPGDGWWLYGAERWAGVTWSPWTMEVPSRTISNSTLENSPFRSTMRELTTKANRDSFSDHARSPTTATKPQAKDLNGTTKHIPAASPTGLWRTASPVDASCPIAIKIVKSRSKVDRRARPSGLSHA